MKDALNVQIAKHYARRGRKVLVIVPDHEVKSLWLERLTPDELRNVIFALPGPAATDVPQQEV